MDWLWYGYLALEHVTLFTGLWKAGKTTLLAHLLKLCGAGGELAGDIAPARVLVVSEESKGLWARRRDELGIEDHVHLINRPFLGRPNAGEWGSFVLFLAELVRAEGFRLVVFDTVASVWPVWDENDAAKVLAALLPLHHITGQGAAVLLIHHPRKGDAGEGQAARGSGALPGFVDVILELRRFAPQTREDRRRTLTAYSRFDETPDEVVVELAEDGYHVVGSKADARQADRLDVIAELLPAEAPGITVEDLREVWPDDGIPKPGRRTLQADLKQGVALGRWPVEGAGTKGDPYRYSIRASSTL